MATLSEKSRQFVEVIHPGANRRFEFQKRSQLFFRTHNEALSVAVRVNNPDRLPVGIHG